MTEQQLIEILLERFYEDFASQTAKIVVCNDGMQVLYRLANDCLLPPAQRAKVMFRAAYVLETIYFEYPTLFAPYIERFCTDFSSCTNESAKRHFTKIMHNLLISHSPTDIQCYTIAEKCAEWTVDPRVRVAVKIWAIEVLRALMDRVDWVAEMLPELLEPLSRNPSPAMLNRLQKWQRKS